jgi:hypothetical protein
MCNTDRSGGDDFVVMGYFLCRFGPCRLLRFDLAFDLLMVTIRFLLASCNGPPFRHFTDYTAIR